MNRSLIVLLLCLTLPNLIAGELAPIFPDVKHDPKLPHPKQVLGFDFGEKIAMHHEALSYAQALAAASDKVSLELRESSWEGRAMALLMVTSKRNHQRLEELRHLWVRLSDPRVTPPKLTGQVVADLPVLVWFQESVHGNEISGTDSGLYMAWHLASAIDHPEIDELLENSVLAIELMQNPDGRDRFIAHSRQQRSPLGGDTHIYAAERDEPWPSGRYNHYNFDMNRDWFAMTQPETKVKVASFLKWFPQVVVDLHEMGGNESFFAAEPSPPANPLLSDEMMTAYQQFGKAIGKDFDARGIDYFHGETFDSFYPGYGESWPSLHGAIGVLFEQGSARGLAYARRDGHILTHREAVSNQVVASYAVLQHAANNREEMLRFFYENRQRALSLEGERQVFLLPGNDPARLTGLGRLLKAQGIEVERVIKSVRSLSVREQTKDSTHKREIPEGSLLVRYYQPAGLLARTLLNDHIDLDPAFLAEQDRLFKRLHQGPQIYDITGWSLPLMHGVESLYAEGTWRGETDYILKRDYKLTNPEAALAFIIPDSVNAGPALAALLQQGVRSSFITRPIEHNGFTFPAGSLVIRRRDNDADLVDRLEKLVGQFEVDVVGVDTSWFTKGPALGSSAVKHIQAPKVLLLWDQPTQAMSAGWMRYVMEQRLGYPITALKSRRLGSISLNDFQVILMPEGTNWSKELGKKGLSRLKDWLSQGGVLVAVGRSVHWLADEKVGLLKTRPEWRDGTTKEKLPKEPEKIDRDPQKMILPLRERPRRSHGALLKVDFDTKHWSCFGMYQQQTVLVDSNRILRPLRLNDGLNPGRFTNHELLLASGHIPVETLENFAHKPFLMVQKQGGGYIIAFTEDPNYRAFQRGLDPLMRNAVFFAHAMGRGR